MDVWLGVKLLGHARILLELLFQSCGLLPGSSFHIVCTYEEQVMLQLIESDPGYSDFVSCYWLQHFSVQPFAELWIVKHQFGDF